MNDVGAQTAQHGRKRRWYGDVRPAAMLWLLLAGAMQPLAVAEPAQTVVDRSQVNAGQMDLCFLTNTCSVGGQSYTSKVGSCTASPGGDPSACEADGPASQSRTDAGSAAGNPIDVATGNKYQKEVDIAALPGVLGLEVVRHYNSRYAQGETKPGILGRGWKLSYETRLYRVGETLQIVQADGTRLIFNRDANNPSQCGTGDATHGRVVIEARGEAETYQWVWTHGASAGRRLYFDERGWLTRIEAPGGEAVSLEYTEAGLLSRVTDPQGRALKVHYPEEKTRDAWRFPGAERIETPAGEIKYSYGQLPEETSLPTYREDEPVQPTEVLTAEEQAAAKKRKSWVLANLERVEWPANGAGERSAVRIYHYEDERYPNLLTGISVAELGSKAERISRYGYDKQGLAKLSERLASGERVELTELAPSKLAGEPGHTVLTDGQGKSTSYRHAQIGGRGRLLETRGAGCPGCSPAERRYVYDTVGREVEVIQLDSSGRAESGVRKEYDDWGRLTGIGQVTYGAGAEAPQWHPLFGVWRLQQTEIQTSDETNEAERVEWLIRYDYAAPQVDEKSGALLALEKPMRITRPSVVEGKEHRIELEYNDAWQVTKVIETGYSPAIPTNVAYVEPSIPESTDPADDDGFIKASTTAGLVGWEERSGSQQNSRDNLNSEASVGWAKQAQRSVPTRTAVTNQPEIPTRNTSTNTDGGFVGWEERSGSQQQSAADLVVAKSSGTNISKTTLSEGLQDNFVRAKCSGTLDSTGRSDCPRLITRTTEYRYRKVNGRSVLVAIDGPLPNGPLGLSTDSDIVRIFWDKQGDYPVRVFMPGGATRAFERDAAGRVVRVTGMPATGATNLAYERNGGLVSAYGDNGFGVSYEYDQFGRRVSSFVLEPGRRIPREHRVFDVSGRLVMEIGATGRINEAVYDEQGRLVISRVQSATYTQEERYDYDLSGRLIGVSDSTGAVRRILRDASGRAVGLIDPLGRMTRIDYDDRGRVRGVERGRAGGEGLRVDYGYDIHGHLVAVEQQGTALGRTERRVTRFVFDDFDRRVAEIDSQTGVVSRDYDEADRLVAERRADGDWSRYRYDPAGRLIYTATGVAGFPDEPYGETHYRYRDGRLVAVEHPEQREHYDYDARGRLVRKEMALRLDAGTWTNYAVVYRYDESGRLIGRSLSDGAELIFERNSSGQVVALKRRLGGWFGSKEQVLAQDLKQGLGGPEQLVYGNGVTGRWERSREGMLGRIRYSRPVKPGAALAAVFGAVSEEAHAAVWDPVVRNDALPGAWNYDLVSDTLHEERLVYDAAGNIAARRRIEAGGDRIKDQFYGYDAFDQLSVAANGRSEDEWNAETRFYFHDPLGDLRLAREGETRAYRETPVTYYDYDGAPMDKAGRQERMNDRRLVWDSLGRLAALEGKDGRIASYRYNHRHLRIAKKVGSRTVHHLYENRQRVADVDEAGRIKRHYIWLGDRLIALIDPEKARLPAAESKPDRDRTTYIHVNHLEAPVLATDEGGRIVWRAEYAPFGALVSLVDPSGLNLELRNPGQWSDAESGLYYNDRRYYDPKTGRYLSPDPLGLAGGDNRYAYAAANPLRWTDPFGLLLFAFDGTGNDETNPQTLSNVVRFREMYDEDERFYITGPGTLDPATGIKNPLYKGGDTADSGFSLTGLDRVAAMEGYLQRYANATDDAQAVNIDIVGFSRGAAQAREFANRIANNYRDGYYYYTDQAGKSRCQKVNLRFMGLFDTVLSTHTGNYNLAIPADFAYVAHAVALNEHRGDNVRASMPGSMGAFPLESILGSPGSYSSTRIEMGFLGAHSDIGGGFTEGELARVALVWMVNQAKAAGLQMAEGHIPKTIIANPVLHDKTTNQYSQTGRPDPDSRSTFEDRQVRYMGGATTTQIEMAGTVMTTADTYAFIHYNPAIDVSNWDEPPREVRIPGSEYSTGTVDMAGYLNWLNQHGYGIDLTVQ